MQIGYHYVVFVGSGGMEKQIEGVRHQTASRKFI